MQSRTVHKNIGLMMFVFACAFMLFAGISAHGQYRDRDDDYYRRGGGIYGQQNGRWGRVSQKELRKAYDRGYKQGLKDGKRDARNGYNRSGGYYGGNRGYGTYGGNGRYNGGYYGGGQIQRAYSDGYDRGYREGYDRNYRYNRNSRYPSYRRPSIFGIPLPY
jgi:hypothetical protein